MKVFVAPPPGLSRAMTRVERALTTYLPVGSHVVKHVEDADLEVLHVIGYPETVERVEAARAAGRRYAVIQYCFESTQEPRLWAWQDIWQGASLVWSYYNLQAWFPFPFYYAPLGLDDSFLTFPRPDTAKTYLLAATGFVAPSECLQECATAVGRRKGRMLHLGHDLTLDGPVTNKLDVTDQELVALYQASRFVAGLRRCEGFELPVYEGLACGARPIVFDAPHYTQWLGPHALYIREESPDSVVHALVQALSTYAPVTSDEMRWVREKFSWKPIIEGFWERAL